MLPKVLVDAKKGPPMKLLAQSVETDGLNSRPVWGGIAEVTWRDPVVNGPGPG